MIIRNYSPAMAVYSVKWAKLVKIIMPVHDRFGRCYTDNSVLSG